MPTFSPGDPVLLRDVYQRRVAYARPTLAVHDRSDLVALYVIAPSRRLGRFMTAFGA